MIDAIDQLQTYLQGKTYEDYRQDPILQRATERLLEILGEAARRIKAEFQAQHPEIEWADIIGLRNIIAHQYDNVSQAQLWEIFQTRLSPLRQKLVILLDSLVP